MISIFVTNKTSLKHLWSERVVLQAGLARGDSTRKSLWSVSNNMAKRTKREKACPQTGPDLFDR